MSDRWDDAARKLDETCPHGAREYIYSPCPSCVAALARRAYAEGLERGAAVESLEIKVGGVTYVTPIASTIR